MPSEVIRLYDRRSAAYLAGHSGPQGCIWPNGRRLCSLAGCHMRRLSAWNRWDAEGCALLFQWLDPGGSGEIWRVGSVRLRDIHRASSVAYTALALELTMILKRCKLAGS